MVGIVESAVRAGDAVGRRDDDEKGEKEPVFFILSQLFYLPPGGMPELQKILQRMAL